MLEGCVPWPEEFVKKYTEAGYWENITIPEAFDEVAEIFPNKEALVFNEERLTFEQLKNIIDNLACKFLQSGLKPLDRIVVQLPNIPEFVYSYFALLKIGVLPVLCLPQHRFNEIEYIARLTEAKGYLIPDLHRKFDYLELAKEISEAVPSVQKFFVAGKAPDKENYFELGKLIADTDTGDKTPSEILKQYRPDPHEVAVFLLSGGTTGLPKVIPRTHNDYLYMIKLVSFHLGFSKYTNYLAIAPLAHNMTLSCPGLTGAFLRGGKAVLASAPTIEILCEIIEKEKITNVGLVPALIVGLLNYEKRDQYDLSSLVNIISGGSKLNPEIAKRVKPELDCNLVQQFGMGEGLLMQTEDISDPERVTFETVGKPISSADELKIVDHWGNEVSVGEVGEMICRGPYTIRGYYKAPEHNQKAFTDDGFYKTGDMVRMDPETGCIIIEGRIKDLINRGGEKISAEEVENLILGHPKVKEVAVVAMPDKLLGERTCAYVILKDQESLELEELNAFLLTKKIAKYKLPERLEIVNEFPLTNVGKVSKKDLRADIEAKLKKEEKAN